jgi:hypothetical protein
VESFPDYFGAVPDPRASNARHNLLEVMYVALAAVLCGAEDCTDMAEFAEAKLGVLREVVKLAHGPPSHDTFSRVFRLLEPEPFEAAFAKFTAAFAGALKGVVAIDGKALRGAYERGRKATPLHLVNVWAAEARLVIGQRLAPGRNEVLGAQQALALLRLDGCIVTADALHCRADTAQAILDTGAHYALALKANQPTLLARAQALIEAADPAGETVSGPARALVSAVHPALSRADARRRQDPLDHRKPAPLGARRRLRRGSRPQPQGQRTAEPRPAAEAGPQHRPSSPRKGLNEEKAQARRMGRRLPPLHARPYAIALPLRGRIIPP